MHRTRHKYESGLPQKSAEVQKPIETREELAKVAGVSHDTIARGNEMWHPWQNVSFRVSHSLHCCQN